MSNIEKYVRLSSIMNQWLSKLPRKYKILMMMAADSVLLPFAFWCSVALRYGTFFPEISDFFWLFLAIPIVCVPIFIRLGLYRAVIRYLDEQIVKTVMIGVTLLVLLLLLVAVMFNIKGVPRSSILIFWVLSSSYIAASRYLARGIIRTLQRRDRRKTPVAIYGAGQAGTQTALALANGPEFRPVLFFDDNPDLHGASVAGIRVYNPQDAFEVMDQFDCYQLLLALPSAPRSRKKEIIKRFEAKNIQLKTIPGMGALVSGTVRIEDIREVGIEDLLGRDPVPPHPQLIARCITDKVVLVTGAGGSIGSEICRQICQQSPKKLILVERSELHLYEIERELSLLRKNFDIVARLADVQDENLMKFMLNEYNVETVYHAAAYKHVPLVESNTFAGVINNVFGTLSVARAALAVEVETFVLISTDKAVRPTNVMGASKRIAELVLQAMAQQKPKTLFCMVRFGNVLGSSGSVIPLFRQQIKSGGPVTVTHKEVTRYFMTIPEAAQLVIQAGAMGEGGDVFVLDMGEPVKIIDLARKLIELSGFTVKDSITGEGDIAIEIVGLRQGEKLYEELLIGDDVKQTSHQRIMKANESFIDFDTLVSYLRNIEQLKNNNDEKSLRTLISELVPEYKPAGN